jgi:hypothetical protein
VTTIEGGGTGVTEKLLTVLGEQFRASRIVQTGFSTQFEYMQNSRQFIVVAGNAAKTDINLALALGLSGRKERRLILVLPKGTEFSTLQRAPWLTGKARPQVYTYSGTRLNRCTVPTEQSTVEAFVERAKPKSLGEELRDATAPAYLGAHSDKVVQLVKWASSHPQLDPAHRKGMRSWQCNGQRVLTIRRTAGALKVEAGIHSSKEDGLPDSTFVGKKETLSTRQLTDITHAVEKGIARRIEETGDMHKADEHWLQAMIRRVPKIVGVEQPALREVPAWRPKSVKDASKKWSRGFIDLLGVDGNGDIRLVETKLAANADHMLILQGLDYYIWAQAYSKVLRERLGAPKRSRIIVHFVIGSTPEGALHVSKHAQAQVDSLTIPYRFQSVTNWFPTSDTPANPTSTLHDVGERLAAWTI